MNDEMKIKKNSSQHANKNFERGNVDQDHFKDYKKQKWKQNTKNTRQFQL